MKHSLQRFTDWLMKYSNQKPYEPSNYTINVYRTYSWQKRW